MKNLTTILFAVFVVLQLLDLYTTKRNLEKPNRSEANPIARRAIKKLGLVPALVLLKAFAIGVGYWAVQSEGSSMYAPLIALNIIYLYVVINNFKILKK